MKRDTAIKLGAALVCAASLATAGVLSARISTSAGRHQLAYTHRAVEGQPVQVGLGIAMGPFRGLLVNFLWIRANQLKEEGKFHESMNLAKAITALQPRYPDVWVFHAWNMAYNISVAVQSPEARWQWVNKGIRLLREQGVVHNPDDLAIHRQLGWIFQHKIGGYTDDANMHYKRQLAAEWTVILGEPPRPDFDTSTAQASEMFASWLAPIAEAPRSLGAVYDAEPSVRALVERIRAEVGQDLDYELLERYTNVRVFLDSMYADLDVSFGPRSAVMRELVADPSLASAWEALLPYLRRKVLVDEYNMDPYRMIRYTRKYGPLDWRHPGAHSLYWSAKGVEGALLRVDQRNAEDFDFLNVDRQIMHSIQLLYRSGQIYFSYLSHVMPTLRATDAETGMPLTETYQATINPYFIEPYGDTIREVVERARESARGFAEAEHRTYSLYAAGYENFLKDTIRFFYRRGQIDRAQEYHRRLLTWEGINVNRSRDRMIDELAQSLEEFIASQFEDERYRTTYVAVSEIDAALQGAYINGLLAGNTDLFRRSFDYARAFHAAYTREQVKVTAPAGETARMEVLDKDFRWVAGTSFATTIASLDVPDARVVYSRAPEDLKRFGYVALRQVLGRAGNVLAALGGESFNQVFPEPEGMDSFYDYLRQRQQRQRTPELRDRIPQAQPQG